MSIKQEINRAAPLVDRVNDAIRENPLAAGLIGAGVAWMLFGAKGLGAVGGFAKSAGEKVASAAANVGSAAAAAGSTALKASSTAAATVKRAATDATEAVASIVPDHVNAEPSLVPDAITDAATAVSEHLQAFTTSGREYRAAIQSRLSGSLERQPLLLGAIGLTIGAGIASTFATTHVENEWMGETGTAARESLKGVVDEVQERAGQVVSDIQSEAVRQGLTMDAAKDTATTIAGKVRNVAETARDSVIQPFK